MTYNGDGTVSSVFVIRLVGNSTELVPLSDWNGGNAPLPSFASEALGTSILAVTVANVAVYLLVYKLTK